MAVAFKCVQYYVGFGIFKSVLIADESEAISKNCIVTGQEILPPLLTNMLP
jgi:hypothetical protein